MLMYAGLCMLMYAGLCMLMYAGLCMQAFKQLFSEATLHTETNYSSMMAFNQELVILPEFQRLKLEEPKGQLQLEEPKESLKKL